MAETRRWTEVPQGRKMLLSSGQQKKRAPRIPQATKLLSHGKHGMEAATLQPRSTSKGGKVCPGSETSWQGGGSHKSVITLVVLELGPEKLHDNLDLLGKESLSEFSGQREGCNFWGTRPQRAYRHAIA